MDDFLSRLKCIYNTRVSGELLLLVCISHFKRIMEPDMNWTIGIVLQENGRSIHTIYIE